MYAAGPQQMLRQLFLHRTGPQHSDRAELLRAFLVLIQRIEAGQWEAAEQIQILNRQVQGLGADFSSLGDIPARPLVTAFSSLAGFSVRETRHSSEHASCS